MAVSAVRKRSELATSSVLAPERYDPRRTIESSQSEARIGDLVRIVRDIVQPSRNLGTCLILDTSNAREGVILHRCQPQDGSTIGSAKKIIRAYDVIISRLRPYLRQVAFVDGSIPSSVGTTVLCSTEFFVLRPRDEQSIAFLVPLLLSKRVQEALAAAQEGGHHPRFNESTLARLPVPCSTIEARDEISARVERAIDSIRHAEASIDAAIRGVDKAYIGSSPEELAREWADGAEKLEPDQPGPPRRGEEAELQRLVAEKYRKQGIEVPT